MTTIGSFKQFMPKINLSEEDVQRIAQAIAAQANAAPVLEPAVPQKTTPVADAVGKPKVVIKKKKKRATKKYEPYYAVDDEMMQYRCNKAIVNGVGKKKFPFSDVDTAIVKELIAHIRGAHIRFDTAGDELDTYVKELERYKNKRFEQKHMCLILSLNYVPSRVYGFKAIIKLYADGCPIVLPKGMGTNRLAVMALAGDGPPGNTGSAFKREAPTEALPPAQAIATSPPPPKKQKVIVVEPPEPKQDPAEKWKYENDINIKHFRDRMASAIRRCRDPKWTELRWEDTYAWVGCGKEEFRAHIESQFQSGMTWDNNCRGGWSLDHMMPVYAFDHTNKEEIKMGWHYTNLKPEWEAYNLWKSCKVLYDMTWNGNRWLFHGRNGLHRGEEQNNFPSRV